MKKQMGCWESLENYTWKIIERVSASLPYLGTLVVGIMMLSSLLTHKASVVGTSSLREASVKAARVGDYDAAQKLYEKCQVSQCQDRVLGATSEVEDLVFPMQPVQREIERYTELLTKYPGHRDIYLVLAKLYAQVNMSAEAQRYYDLARELDPNNQMIILF